MDEHLLTVQRVMEHQIELKKNLMARGLVGVKEIRASSQLSRYPPTLHPNVDQLRQSTGTSDLKNILPSTVANRAKNQSVLQIDSKRLSPR